VIDPVNFDIEDIRDYVVDWTITPELDWNATPDCTGDFQVYQQLRYGEMFIVRKGNYERNTEYSVQSTVTHYKH
jgi:hypothetical protein